MKKINKIRAIKYQLTFRAPDGRAYGYVEYDIRKIRRTDKAELKALLFEKSLQLYPYAIIEDFMLFEDKGRIARFFVTLPLSPVLRVSNAKGGRNDER